MDHELSIPLTIYGLELLLPWFQGIATTEGIRGFWKGNLVNILRTAPFKSINFYAYDTYRGQLLSLYGNEETIERFVAGAAAGVTSSLLCLPLDTIRTVMVAPGGEALGGVVGAFRHMIQTEGFFSLYKARLAFREMIKIPFQYHIETKSY
uniref:Mitochondrial carrier protein n=1 Tax=Brassica oleracea TaxID=3712 RepID=A0A3P6G837_BRAOL|nr:unnamed protein product [Brassica oleracea]